MPTRLGVPLPRHPLGRGYAPFAAVGFSRAAGDDQAESRGHGAPVPTGFAGSAKPAPTTRAPPSSPICCRRIADRVESRGRWSAGLRPASRGSAKPAPMTVRRTDVSGAPPAQSGLRRSPRYRPCRPEVGVPLPARRFVLNQHCAARPAARGGADQRSAFPCRRVACAQSGLRRSPRCAGRCRPEVGVPLPARRLCSIGIAPSARLRRAVPTGGRRSLAGASSCPWGYPPRCVARRLASRSEGERGGGGPPFTLSPRNRGQRTEFAAIVCCALGSTPPAQNHGDMERRPVLPVGASDRHRAGARNPPQQRRAPPISPLRTAFINCRSLGPFPDGSVWSAATRGILRRPARTTVCRSKGSS